MHNSQKLRLHVAQAIALGLDKSQYIQIESSITEKPQPELERPIFEGNRAQRRGNKPARKGRGR